MTDLEYRKASMHAVLFLAEEGREQRSDDRPIQNVTWDGGTYTGTCRGYEPTIKLYPARSFRCSCVDHQKTRGSIGPCKHVIALAKAVLATLA